MICIKNLFLGDDKIFKSEYKPRVKNKKKISPTKTWSYINKFKTGKKRKIPPLKGTELFAND